MFAKRNKIQPLVEPSTLKPAKQGGAVDHVAAATAMLVAGLGFTQLFAPLLVNPMTGFESGLAAQIIALQWIVFGGLLFFGGLFRIRVLTIFAAEFLMLAGLTGVAATMLHQGEMIPLLIHGGIAITGLVNSGLARLTDKAELKRELHFAKANAAEARKKQEIRDDGEETRRF
ncbi:hypothetical protein [Altererythrobacter sp. MTPC7]|uniref:hypothetical protein n=1 Tax=Altererythrobacter sp. MTPC7 TaxID=3056567 RepID=UPI0036F31CEA